MKEYEQILETVFEKQIENIKKDILKHNPKVTDFKVYSEKTKNYNIFLVYGTGHATVFSHIYRMIVIEKDFENGSKIFDEGNALCAESYTIEDVKQRAKNRLTNAINQL